MKGRYDKIIESNGFCKTLLLVTLDRAHRTFGPVLLLESGQL